MNIKSGSDSIYTYIYIFFNTYISTYKHIFIQIVEAIFKIFELKHFQRAHHINIYIITIITVIIIEFQKLKYFLNLNFSNTFQFSSNAFSPNQRLVPE